jgi:hypothetical protein
MKFGMILMAVLLMATPALAADIDGKWVGSIMGPDGSEFPISYTFKADGNKFTGTTPGLDGSEIMIKDGKIDGANISFSVTSDFGGMPFTIPYKGVLTGDQLKISGDMLGQVFEFVLKKEAPKK